MLPLTPHDIRGAFVNASRKEVSDLTLPPGFTEIEWNALDYLGWRDPKLARRAYLVIPVEGGVTGVMLRQGEASPRQRAQCSWCQDVTLPNPVVFYAAKRAGEAGRRGDTVGTLICEDFECSANVRKLPPMAYLGFDAQAARSANIAGLQMHAAAFAGVVRNGS